MSHSFYINKPFNFIPLLHNSNNIWCQVQLWIYTLCTFLQLPITFSHKSTGWFIKFSVITNIYDKITKGPSLMEFFTDTGKLKKFFLTTRDVRCAPWMAWRTSIRYSSSCQKRINMGASIFITAAMIHAFRSARSCGNGGTNTQSLTYPQRKKSQGVIPGDLGCQSISVWSFLDARLIQRPGKTVFRY